MSTILFLSPRYPWPLVGGDRVKTHFLLRHLAREHRVILITFNHGGPADPERLRVIREMGVDVRAIPLNPLHAGFGAMRTFWTPMPLEVAFYTRPEFADEVNAVLATEKVDAVISFFMRTAEYVRKRTGLRKILVAEDCRVLYQSRSARATNNALQRMVRWWETRKLRAYEPRVADDFDVTTLVSAHDLENMRLNNPRARYSVVTNGVDAERFWFRADQHDRQGLLFAGKLDVQANHLMALTVLQEVYPEIKRYMPEAPLQIVGARPLPELLKVVEGVATLHRDVPDVLPFLHTSSVFVHPHKGGSGIQNKVLEAMAAGCVVVTTPSGLQGINAQHGVHCLVGATSREVADHAVRLLNDAPLRTELAYRARMLMESEHTWERVGEQIDAVLNGVAHPQPQTV